jgi:UDP-N-acetylglucosamine 2-epimerase
MLAGTDPNKILECVKTMLTKKIQWKKVFGDGKASEKILQIFREMNIPKKAGKAPG